MESLNAPSKRRLIFPLRPLIAAALALLILGGVYVYFAYIRIPAENIILDAPYRGLFNDANTLDRDTLYTMATMAAFLRSDISDEAINAAFPPGRPFSFSEVAEVFKNAGFKTEIKTAKRAEDLREFLNSRVRLPVMVSLKPAADYPGEIRAFTLVVGKNEDQKLLFLHDPYYGPYRQISFDEFDKLWLPSPLTGTRQMLAIKPKNGLPNLLNPASPPKENQAIKALAPHRLLWLYASELYFGQEDYLKAEEMWQSIFSDPLFLKLRPKGRVEAYAAFAWTELRLKKYKEALGAANKAAALNHDLNKPFGDWPGYSASEIALPYLALAAIHKAQGNKSETRAAYEKALSIEPNNLEAKEALENLKK